MLRTRILCSEISRLSLSISQSGWTNVAATRLISSSTTPLLFKTSPLLMAEPLKKKKRIDPAVIKQREERKKKKLERAIKKLEKNARQLKPIDELEVPLSLIDERTIRTRKLPALSAELEEERALLHKEWSTHKHAEKLQDIQLIDKVLFSQQKALDELRKESEELYEEAIQMDLGLLPFKAEGPVWTPPSKEYESPDGEYTDVSRKWE